MNEIRLPRRVSDAAHDADTEYRHKYVEVGTDNYKHACRDALEKQAVKYAIAPGQAVSLGQRVFGAYEEITLSDMQDPSKHPKDAMQDLINRGLVIEKKGLA